MNNKNKDGLKEFKNDYFSNTKDDPYNNTKFYKVDNYDELYQDYSYVFDDKEIDDIVFYIRETETFLRRENTSRIYEEDQLVDIDDAISDKEAVKRASFFKKPKPAREEESGNEWIEYCYEDVEHCRYPGYIPISPCLSSEYGKSSSVSFSYSFSQQSNIQKTFSSTFGVPLGVFSASVALALDAAITKSKTTQGQIQCTINEGAVGQVLLKPNYISCVPKKRKVRWLSKLRRLSMSSKFQRYEKVFLLLENNFFQIDCATSDVVDLFCNSELGVQDWESPLGIGYEDIIYEKETMEENDKNDGSDESDENDESDEKKEME